jgi:hypothetical protein
VCGCVIVITSVWKGVVPFRAWGGAARSTRLQGEAGGGPGHRPLPYHAVRIGRYCSCVGELNSKQASKLCLINMWYVQEYHITAQELEQ